MRLAGFLTAAVCVAQSIAGCGTPQQPWGSVEGSVTLNNAPVANVTVLFSDPSQGVSLYGQSDAQGKFKIVSAKAQGIPVGKYRVAIVPAVTAVDMAENDVVVTRRPPEVKSPVALRYRDLKTTDLSATVKEGENRFDFALSAQ